MFFTLFGAVAVVGVLGAGIMSTMRGPLTTMVEVNRIEETKAEMSVSLRLLLLKAGELDSTTPAADVLTEPVMPANCTGTTATGAGCIPGTTGARQKDAWGTSFAYCAWNNGSNHAAISPHILAGDVSTNNISVALISAGPDRKFQTSCVANPGSGSGFQVISPADGGGDDIVRKYNYNDAVAGSDGLWALQVGAVGDEARIEEEINVGGGAGAVSTFEGGATFGNNLTTTGNVQADVVGPNPNGTQDFVEFTHGILLGDSDTCTNGMLRIRASKLELCLGGDWDEVGKALWIEDANGMRNDDALAARVGIGTASSTTYSLFVNGGSATDTLKATSTVDFDATLNVDGAVTLKSTAGIDGAATLGSTLDVTGATKLADKLEVTKETDMFGDLSVNSDVFIKKVSGAKGNLTVDDKITASEGDITATAGNVVATAGNVEATAGDVKAGQDVIAQRHVNATTGDITAAAGNISATSGNVSAGGDVTATGKVTGGSFHRGDGGALDFSDIEACDPETEKTVWSAVSGWGCEPDNGTGTGTGGESTLEDVLGRGNDAGGTDAEEFGRLGADEFCDAGLGSCVSSAELISGSTVWKRNTLDPAKIYYNDGNVGIGTDTPASELDIHNASSTGSINISTGQAAGLASVQFLTARPDLTKRLTGATAGSGNKGWMISTTQEANATAPAEFRLQYFDDVTWQLFMRVLKTGEIGIGRAPKTKLDVNGTLRIGDGTELCNAADHEGAIKYDAATDEFYVCRNSATGWEPISSSTGGGGSSGDTMVEGWPDAILCNTTTPAQGKVIYYHYGDASVGNNYQYYVSDVAGTSYQIWFTSAGAYQGSANVTASDCHSKSIATLYSEGKAFNFVGGGSGVGGGAGAKGLDVTGSTTSVPNLTNTDVVFSAAPTKNDFGADAWTGNSTFTVPAGEDGWYNISAMIRHAGGSANANLTALILKNGSSIYLSRDVSGAVTGAQWLNISGASYLVAGDVIKLQAYHGAGTTMNLSNANMAIVKLGGGGSGGSGGGGGQDVSFNVYQTAAQAAAPGTGTKITFESERFDANDNFDIATDRFTPTVAGKYVLTATVALAALPIDRSVQAMIYKNGNPYTYGSSVRHSASGESYSTVSAVVDANGSTDYFELYVRNGDGTWARNTIPGAASVTFAGALVGGGGGGGNDTLAGLSCTSGQVAAWNGTAWACSTPSAGGAGEDVSFSAKPSSSQSIPNVTATKMLFVTESFDSNNNFDGATGRFTPTVAGKYILTASGQMGDALGPVKYAGIGIYKNGTLVHRQYTYNADGGNNMYANPTVSAVVSANGTTDFFEVFFEHNHGSARSMNAGNNTFFTGALVGGGGAGGDSLWSDSTDGYIEYGVVDAGVKLQNIHGLPQPALALAPGVTWMQGTSTLQIDGNITYTGTVTDISDRRLKEDIEDLVKHGSMLDKINAIGTYSFRMKGSADTQKEFGVMAQELEEIFPELVRTANDEFGTKSVNYVGLIAPLIEATKELSAQNAILKADNRALLAENASQRQTTDARFMELEAQVSLLNGIIAEQTTKKASSEWLWLMLAIFGGLGVVSVLVFAEPRSRRRNDR